MADAQTPVQPVEAVAWIEPEHLAEQHATAKRAGYPMPLVASTAQVPASKIPLYAHPGHGRAVMQQALDALRLPDEPQPRDPGLCFFHLNR